MGAGQSISHPEFPTRGLHVLRVNPSSPSFHANIEPFFDFVTGFEGDSLSSENDIDASELEKIVESHENRVLNLIVWSSKSQQTRVVPITPSRIWSQQPEPQLSSSSMQPSLLGLSMRLCQPETATENVWHVLDVIEGSPAESAGLVPMGDWILGWSGGVLSAENDFYDLVEAHADKPLRVYVYSYDFDNLREVVLIPNRHWGGDGLLGCVFGFGLLHRIPPQPDDREPGTMPREIQEQDENNNQELFIPADVEADGQHTPQNPEWRHQIQDALDRKNVARSALTHSNTLNHGNHFHSPIDIRSSSPPSNDMRGSTRLSSSNEHLGISRTRSPLSNMKNENGSSGFSQTRS